jgi:hypothetical protein
VSAPEPPFEHLLRLSDDTGLLEHARGAVPRRECGYCLDDAARVLVVANRHPSPPAAVEVLAERYLAFVSHAQVGSGAATTASAMTGAGKTKRVWAAGEPGGRHDRP